MIDEKRNFLIVEFGDNDFGYQIAEALKELATYWTNNNVQYYCPYAIKRFLIVAVSSYYWKKNALEGAEDWQDFSISKWLSGMRVTFRQHMPTYTHYPDDTAVIDHDGGSAGLNLHTGETFTF